MAVRCGRDLGRYPDILHDVLFFFENFNIDILDERRSDPFP